MNLKVTHPSNPAEFSQIESETIEYLGGNVLHKAEKKTAHVNIIQAFSQRVTRGQLILLILLTYAQGIKS